MNYWTLSEKNIWVAAHRGWLDAYPENTMEAFIAAEKLGVDQIETDVRITKDGELVLIHDAAVDRTTNGTGLVKDFTFEELRALDAGSHKGEQFKGCKIPTFVELMEHFKDHPTMTIDIELKEYPTEGWEEVSYSVCDRIVEIVEKYGYGDRVVLNTFSGKLHDYIREKYGDKYRQHVFFPQDRLGECAIDPYSYAYCCCMFSSEKGKPMATREECLEMLERGVQPWAGAGVKTEEDVDACIEAKVHLITTNAPDKILQYLRARGYHK